MIELALFIGHLFAAFGLTVLFWHEEIVLTPGFRNGREAIGYRKRSFLVLLPLALLELITGAGLLLFPEWRDSAFAPALLICPVIWILEGLIRPRFLGPPDQPPTRWRRAGWISAGAYLARSVSLMMIALF